MTGILKHSELERLIRKHWGEIIDTRQVFRILLEKVRDTPFKVVRQPQIPPIVTKLTITSVTCLKERAAFELWVEFHAPKDEGVVIGTLICVLSLNDELTAEQIFGTQFLPETSDNIQTADQPAV